MVFDHPRAARRSLRRVAQISLYAQISRDTLVLLIWGSNHGLKTDYAIGEQRRALLRMQGHRWSPSGGACIRR
eukprot:8434993-Pyramimonas_sp.AAC.1